MLIGYTSMLLTAPSSVLMTTEYLSGVYCFVHSLFVQMYVEAEGVMGIPCLYGYCCCCSSNNLILMAEVAFNGTEYTC